MIYFDFVSRKGISVCECSSVNFILVPELFRCSTHLGMHDCDHGCDS